MRLHLHSSLKAVTSTIQPIRAVKPTKVLLRELMTIIAKVRNWFPHPLRGLLLERSLRSTEKGTGTWLKEKVCLALWTCLFLMLLLTLGLAGLYSYLRGRWKRPRRVSR